MKRGLALVGALAMVAVAVLVRQALDDTGGGGGGGGGGRDSSEPATLACDTALGAVCRELAEAVDGLEVVVESASATAARFADADRPADVGLDGWLTLDPQPGLVSEDRDRAGQPPLLADASAPVARSPLVLVAWSDRGEALAASCGQLDWRCLGDRAGQRWEEGGGAAAWGRVEPGLADPAGDAVGLVVGGQAAASWFGDADFASNDFDAAFRAWWNGLLDAVPRFPASRGTLLAQMLAAGPSSYDAVGTTEAEAVPAVARSRDADRLTISYPAPMVTADVVLVPVLGSSAAEDLEDLARGDDLASALSAAGWRVDDRPLPDGVDTAVTLPDDTGLPRTGVLDALRAL